MAVKRWTGSSWVDVANVRRWNGVAWDDQKPIKRWNGTAWVDTISYIQRYTKYYSLLDNQIYWNSGAKDSITGEHIQGTWDGTSGNLRRTMMILRDATMANDLSGATIVSVRLRMKRLDTTHGTTTATVQLYGHNYSTVPTTWTGDNIDLWAVTDFTRGQEQWIGLSNLFGERLRDNTLKGIAISITNTSNIYYARMDASRTLLEIVYDK